MKLHNPLPQSIEEDINKCAHILEKFTKRELASEKASFMEKVIPANIIANCKGIAIMTVLKAGFIWSGRTGTGLVVARLQDGSWSAPSAIGTIGAGVGGQIGAELTDFVIILNTRQAVEAFSMGGNVTLGGNLSVAAGPFGRSAEAGGSVGKLAPIYSYSKTKGLFAGISIEGSVIVERKDANHRFYGQRYTPKEILSGNIPAPASAQPLYKALERQSRLTHGGVELSSVFSNAPGNKYTNKPEIITNPPSYSGQATSTYSSGQATTSTYSSGQATTSTYSSGQATSTYSKSPLQQLPSKQLPSSHSGLLPIPLQPPVLYSPPSESPVSPVGLGKRIPPPIPRRFSRAVALFDFEGERETDLTFRKGDEITITKKTASTDDWWSGQILGKSGDFPANYVELLS